MSEILAPDGKVDGRPDGCIDATQQLVRSIGLLDLVMLSAGSAMGVGIFSVLTPAAQIGGSGILITLVLSAVPMIVFGAIYSFMSSFDPRSGASFEWPRTYLHPFAGFTIAWLRIFGSIGQITMIAIVLVNYIQIALPIPTKPSVFALFAIVFLINLRGISLAARAQTVLMLLLIATLMLFVISGAPHVEAANILPLAPDGLWPILLAAPIMINLFMGIEAATEVGEEVVDAERVVPLGILGSVCLITAVYALVMWTAVGVVGADRLAQSEAPLIAAASVALPGSATLLILAAASISLLKSLNASFLIFSRSLFAMGRSQALSKRLASVRGDNRTPTVAVIVAFLCVCTGLLLPNSLVFLFLASNIPTILKYMAVSACALKIAATRPDLMRKAKFKLVRGQLVPLAILGMLFAIGLFLLGYESDWRPYALVGAWGLIGCLYWIYRQRALTAAAKA